MANAQKQEKGSELMWQRRLAISEGKIKSNAEDTKLLKKTPAQMREYYEIAF